MADINNTSQTLRSWRWSKTLTHTHARRQHRSLYIAGPYLSQLKWTTISTSSTSSTRWKEIIIIFLKRFIAIIATIHVVLLFVISNGRSYHEFHYQFSLSTFFFLSLLFSKQIVSYSLVEAYWNDNWTMQNGNLLRKVFYTFCHSHSIR